MIKIDGNKVTICGKSVLMSKRAALIFKILNKHKGEAVKTEDIIALVWPDIEINKVSRQYLTIGMNTLRKNLATISDVKIITHSKYGYEMQSNNVIDGNQLFKKYMAHVKESTGSSQVGNTNWFSATIEFTQSELEELKQIEESI